MSIQKIIKQQVALNLPQKALTILLKVYEKQKLDENELILLQGNLTRINEEKRKGNLSKEQERIEFSKINNAIIEITGLLPENISWDLKPNEQNKLNVKYWIFQNQYYLIGFLSLSFVGLIWLLNSFPKIGIKTKLELSLRSIIFETVEDDLLILNQDCIFVNAENFRNVSIPASKLIFLDEQNKNTSLNAKSGLIEISADIMEFPNIYLKNIYFESLAFSKHTILKFTRNIKDTSINIVANHGFVTAELNFQDSLHLEGENFHLSGLKNVQKMNFTYFEGTAFTPNYQLSQLSISGQEDAVAFGFSPKKMLKASGENQKFKAKKIDFKFKKNIEKKSGLIEGNIFFIDKKEKSYEGFIIKQPYFLEVVQCQPIEIISFSLSNGNINIIMEGLFHTIKTGSNYDAGLTIRNPSIFCWLYYNQIIILFLLCLLPFLSIIFIIVYPKY